MSGALRIGDPNDSSEREADRVADEVIAGRSAPWHWSLSGLSNVRPLQRKCSCGGPAGAEGECEQCEAEKQGHALQRKVGGTMVSGAAPPIVHDVINAAGRPLDMPTRDYFEPRFGRSLADVRVHADPDAAESAKAVGAEAYAVGQNIVFGTGRYQPDTPDGRKLLAHELAHTVQQSGSRCAQSALEQEAEGFARTADNPTIQAPALSLGAARHSSDSFNPLLQATLQAGVSTPSETLPSGRFAGLPTTLTSGIGTVRIHRNPVAHAAARLAGAHAYARGSDIVLGPEASDISSGFGQRTFAHELAHVGQQTGFRRAGAMAHTQFSLKTYIAAMNEKPEPDWNTAAIHLNGESPTTIRIILKNLSSHYRAKLHEAAREWPGLCSNIGRFTEADYLREHPDTRERVANVCDKPAPATPATKAAGSAAKTDIGESSAPEGGAESSELTEKDAKSCSPLYRQKLCVYIIGGFNGDRSGVPTPEDMAGYNKTCRDESGYTGKDIDLSDEERVTLRTPQCERLTPAEMRQRVISARINEALDRSVKYMAGGIGQQIVAMVKDPVFIASLVLAIGLYLALWLAPEPLFTKLSAAATTIAILSTGLFTVSTIKNLAVAWLDLEDEAGSAETPEALEAAAERFGTRMGRIEANLLVFLASLLVGGRLPGPKGAPQAAEALVEAERALTAARPGAVVIEGPWGRARVMPVEEPLPTAVGNTALKIQPASAPARPAEVIPLPAPKPAPVPAAAKAPSPVTPSVPVIPVVPGVGQAPEESKKKRPPFVLWLPKQKDLHLVRYRSWLGALQSDPNFERGNPAQLDKWHQAHRIGGSVGIPREVYERGHRLGLTGEAGERRIRVPDWSSAGSVEMQVDHIIELQLTPPGLRDEFDSIFNYELLDAGSNRDSGNLLKNNVRRERAKQIAFDPSLKDQVLPFDQVEVDGGASADRWSSEDIRAGEQLDAYEKQK